MTDSRRSFRNNADMIGNIEQCDPYVLGTIIDKYRKRNEALEKRESAIIKILADIDREKADTSDIEDKIRTAISDSKTFDYDVRQGSSSTINRSCSQSAHNSDYYPRLSGRTDSYKPLPPIEYECVPRKRFNGRGLDLDSEHLKSWRKLPIQDVSNVSSERELTNYSKPPDEHYDQHVSDSSLDNFAQAYSGIFMSDSKRECVRAASPVDRSSSRRSQDGGERIHRNMEAMRSDPDVDRLLEMTDLNVLEGDANDSDSSRFTDTVDSMMSFDAEPKRTFADNKKQSYHEHKEDLSEYMKDFLSPSIHEMIQSYEQRHKSPRANDDYKRKRDCDRRSRADYARRAALKEEDSRPVTRDRDQRASLFPAAESKSRRSNSSRGSSTINSTTLGRPFSDSSDKDTSIESIKSSGSRRTKNALKSDQLASFDCSSITSTSGHSNLSDIQGTRSQQSSVHNDSDLDDTESEPYEFEENYSNNYLKFLIRNCMPRSLLRSEYNSSYNWSIENKQDIFNRIEEIELIKKVICEELDYRELINKPFKLHRNDRRFLLRNIMYSEAVKLALSKGLPICGVMALFAETGSAENIKQLTLQMIRQANEILGESHPDPSGLDNIVLAAEECVHKLAVLDKRTARSNPSKLCKILQDIIAREPILDPHENLQKCIDELTNLQVDDDTQAFDEVDSLRCEVCRLRNIIWSVEEHASLKTRRANAEDADSSTQNKTTRRTPKNNAVSHRTRDDQTKEEVRLMGKVGRMRRLVHELEHDVIPRAVRRKKEAERTIAREKPLTDDSLTSCDSYRNTHPMKSTETVYNERYDKQTSSQTESTVSSVASQTASASDVTDSESVSLKDEVDRLRSLVENMERRFVVDGSESEDSRKNNVNDLKTASEDNTAHLKDSKVSTKTCSSTETTHSCTREDNTAHLKDSKVSTKTCSSTQTTHSCTRERIKNTGNVHTRVIYVVANKDENAPHGVKRCIRRTSQMVTKSISNDLQNEKTPNTVSCHTVMQKTRPAVTLALTSNTDKESDEGEHEQVETAIQKSNESVCTTSAKEQTGTPCENVNNCISRNLPVIPETSDVFISAMSIPCVSKSTNVTNESIPRKVDDQQVNDKSTCSKVTPKTNECETNKTISIRKSRNPAENMWENMVDAFIPGIASKRRLNAGESTTRTVTAEAATNEAGNSPKEVPGLDDQCSNKQSEEMFFKIIQKSGSAYEISSSALLNENDKTPDPTSGEASTKGLVDDLSKHLALAVKICKGPESAAESLKEAFRESYVATCEKAINEALKDLINSYPLDGGKKKLTNKSKKTSRKRSAIELDDTTLSDCSPQYTRDDIVIVGTTKMNNGRNAANDQSFTTTVTKKSSKKKERALAAMQEEEEMYDVSYESSDTTLTLVNSDEKECRSVVHEGSRTTIVPSTPTTRKDQAPTTTGKGIANRIQSRYNPRTKIAKPLLALTGRRVGNKGEPSNGINAPRKKNIAAGTGKAIKKTGRPFKLINKEGYKNMQPGDKVANESSPGRKTAKCSSFRQETSDDTCISNRTRSKKTPSGSHDFNSEVAVLFDGADRMEEKESNENFDADEPDVVGDRTQDKTHEMDCTSALKTVSHFEIGVEYKRAMSHVKNCPSCTKKLLPTLLQVVNKVEDMTRQCENPDTSKNNSLKGTQEQENKRPRAPALRGQTR